MIRAVAEMPRPFSQRRINIYMQSSKKTAIFAAFIMAAAFGLVGQARAQGPTLNEMMKRMDAHYKALSSLRADVAMSKFNSQLKDTETVSGTAIYAPRKGKDALVRIDWKSPEESLAVIDKTYYIYRPRLQQAYTGSTASQKGNSKAAGALSFMSMSRAQLRQNYDVTLLGQEEKLSDGTVTVHIKLTPKAKTSYQFAELWVDSDGMPRQSKIVEANNDATTVLLTKLQKNGKIDANEFKIQIPKTVKVIKN